MAKHANGLSRGSGSISLMRIGLESFGSWDYLELDSRYSVEER